MLAMLSRQHQQQVGCIGKQPGLLAYMMVFMQSLMHDNQGLRLQGDKQRFTVGWHLQGVSVMQPFARRCALSCTVHCL